MSTRQPMQTIRTSVPPAVFAEIDHRAEKAGVTLARYVRQVLTEHAADFTDHPPVTPREWAHFREFVAMHPGVLATYKGARDWKVPANRSAVLSWAVATVGYDPSAP